ncbi:unnamed protein product (mitochondrion) [Plasmodiophora brassicae]|uniref:Glycosyl transferase family 28 C-terminal domain-containing protein n=1 Tax=Plasmodiophora brassicae TaxID=37360 RepID=A0A0G4IL92_PLABS|nr:hypothetical protein PBRA_004619 [Plasmodiophora brassicae]SPQ93522.1 unnamed protein product [Plasmodiophora brassicae]
MSDDGGRVGTCLVTVGTTQFDALIDTLDREYDGVLKAVVKRGMSRLHVQYGKSAPPCQLQEQGRHYGVTVVADAFVEKFNEVIAASDLVVSHAGAGSIIESLRAGKPLIVVVNDTLMDNHQLELAENLADQGHLIWAPVTGVVDALANANLDDLRPLPAANSRQLWRDISHDLGFHSSSI